MRMFGFFLAVLLSVAAAAIGAWNDRFSHDRRAARAFFNWKESPTPEKELR